MTEILIVGNPNAGKTTLLNRLTGARLKTGNWQGVTVSPASVKSGEYLFTDIPGSFTLNYFSLEEKAAADYITSHRGAFVINAVDAFSVKRSLRFTKELISLGIKPIIAVTKIKQYSGRGKIDLKEISYLTGCAVVDADFITLKTLPQILKEAESSLPKKDFNEEKLNFAEARLSVAEKFLLNPFINLFCFAAAFALTFFVSFGEGMVGETLKNLIANVFSFLADKIGENINSQIVRSFACDCVINGVGGVLSFLPQIAILYAALIALEDSGVMAYFAYMTDDIFSLVGLSGRAAFSLLLGFGCTSAAMCSAKSFSSKRSSFTAALTLQYIPCSARLPVLLTLFSSFFKNPFPAVALLYFLSVTVALSAAYLSKGKGKEAFLMELPVLRLPNFLTCAKSLIFQLRQFIIKVATVMFAFLAAAWLLSLLSSAIPSVFSYIGGSAALLFYPMGITDPKIAFSALSGVIAKENIAGALNMFYPNGIDISAPSAVALSVFIMLSPPCVSAFSAASAHIGGKAAALSYFIQLVISLVFAYAAYLILTAGGAFLIPVAAAFALILALKRFLYERIYRKRKNDVKGIYR